MLPSKIEAVTVCVGYADFLMESIPANIGHFDRWVIVTTEGDTDTFDVCHRFGLHCLTTGDFHRDGDFNKGRGVQRGLNNIASDEWVIQIDADIVLPPAFRQSLESAHLDPSKIYGCDRMNVVGWDEWQRVKRSNYNQRGYHCYVRPHPDYPIGTRWSSPTDGYVPIGFFQMWHGSDSIRKGIHHKPYPGFHSGAARSDVQFGLRWDRRKRELLPEIIAWHLESQPAPMGHNWKGRKTRPFGPPLKLARPGGPS